MEDKNLNPEGEQEDKNTEGNEPEGNESEGNEPEGTDPQEDYKTKLNIQNRFLEKEGYKFDENTKKWVKEEKPAPKVDEADPPPASEKRLSDADLLYLSKVDMHEEDLSEVRTYAEKMGKSIKDSHEFLKPVIDSRVEERKSAEVANTKRSPRGDNKQKGSELYAQAQKGQFPSEEDDSAIDALVKAEAAAKAKPAV